MTTTLDLITRGGVASPAYLDVERTLTRAAILLACDRAPVAAYLALDARLRAHAEQTFRDHVREQRHTLPSGLAVTLPTWTSEHARLTYSLLLTYRAQAEQRIIELQR